MTRDQKQRLAAIVIKQVAHISEFYGEEGLGEDLASEGVEWQEVADTLSLWLQHLPGDSWSTQLPLPSEVKKRKGTK